MRRLLFIILGTICLMGIVDLLTKFAGIGVAVAKTVTRPPNPIVPKAAAAPAQERVPGKPPPPKVLTAKEAAIANCVAYIRHGDPFNERQILDIVAHENDVEFMGYGEIYPITVIALVRIPGASPTGFIKVYWSFGCDAKGRFIAPLD